MFSYLLHSFKLDHNILIFPAFFKVISMYVSPQAGILSMHGMMAINMAMQKQ